MAKIQKLSELSQSLPFTEYDFYDFYRLSFERSMLGQMKKLVDGLSFIEKLSFNDFNEGTRLLHCVKMHKRLFGVDVKKVGSDHFLRNPHRQCGATRRADDGTAEDESCLKGRL